MTTPTAGQLSALSALEDFLSQREDKFFLLHGAAGTGKTFCVRELVSRVKGRLIFTAPTNKATKVLRSLLTTDAYKPECRTIYSLLGLRLEASGEIKELAYPEDPVDLSRYSAVIVDEASMINRNLLSFIQKTASEQRVLFIFLGDRYQLPPVKENESPIWSSVPEDQRAELTQVVRQDNAILAQVSSIRDQVFRPAPQFKRLTVQGEVLELPGPRFNAALLQRARAGEFSEPENIKAIAWRNATVDGLNKLIRSAIFDNAAESFWLPGDRLITTAPASDLEDNTIATTDDEGLVTGVDVVAHPLFPDFWCWRLSVTMDTNALVELLPLHPQSFQDFERKKNQLLTDARANGRMWKAFWEFNEAFHSVRHAYAITAHRAQGSTYNTAFVDWRDILLNRARREAFQCLYVAASRPRKLLAFN